MAIKGTFPGPLRFRYHLVRTGADVSDDRAAPAEGHDLELRTMDFVVGLRAPRAHNLHSYCAWWVLVGVGWGQWGAWEERGSQGSLV